MTEKTSQERFYERENISQANKDYVTKFFKSYNCAESTKEKFYSELPYLLSMCKDINKTMLDKSAFADIFDKLHKKLSPSTYKIVVDCSKALCKFLNDGKLPDTFNFIKKHTKEEKKQMSRVNQKGYKTFSWEDGLKIAEQTNSLQLKAMVLTELDAGLRPRELERLNYVDAKKEGKFIFLEINETKTGEPRDVLLTRSAPVLNRWLQMHPTKKNNDPLWIVEHKDMSSKHRNGEGEERYNYHAIRQTLRRLARKAGFKQANLYMMRHSAVTMCKEEQMPMELGAERFGHNINYYIGTYGKMTRHQKKKRFKAYAGDETEKDKVKTPKPIDCPICGTINEPGANHCEKCNTPLNLTSALKEKEKKNKEITELKEQMATIISQIHDLQTLKAEKARRQGK